MSFIARNDENYSITKSYKIAQRPQTFFKGMFASNRLHRYIPKGKTVALMANTDPSPQTRTTFCIIVSFTTTTLLALVTISMPIMTNM